jgi:hypothetical protein
MAMIHGVSVGANIFSAQANIINISSKTSTQKGLSSGFGNPNVSLQ